MARLPQSPVALTHGMQCECRDAALVCLRGPFMNSLSVGGRPVHHNCPRISQLLFGSEIRCLQAPGMLEVLS